MVIVLFEDHFFDFTGEGVS